MREARRLLRTPGQSIAEFAYGVGFQDSNYFSRAFRQHHGMSPREFRDMARIGG
jgi:AraC-like DNA-binding protein